MIFWSIATALFVIGVLIVCASLWIPAQQETAAVSLRWTGYETIGVSLLVIAIMQLVRRFVSS